MYLISHHAIYQQGCTNCITQNSTKNVPIGYYKNKIWNGEWLILYTKVIFFLIHFFILQFTASGVALNCSEMGNSSNAIVPRCWSSRRFRMKQPEAKASFLWILREKSCRQNSIAQIPHCCRMLIWRFKTAEQLVQRNVSKGLKELNHSFNYYH